MYKISSFCVAVAVAVAVIVLWLLANMKTTSNEFIHTRRVYVEKFSQHKLDKTIIIIICKCVFVDEMNREKEQKIIEKNEIL